MLYDIKRFKLAFNKNAYEEQLTRIERANRFLRDTTHQNRLLEHFRSNNVKLQSVISSLRQIRKDAKSLHHSVVLGHCWKCPCRGKHIVNLDMLNPIVLGQQYGRPTGHTLKVRVLMDSASIPNVSPFSVASARKSLWQVLEVWSDQRHDEHSVVAPIVKNSSQNAKGFLRSKKTKKTVKFAEAENSVAQTHDTPVNNTVIDNLCSVLKAPQPKVGSNDSIGYLRDQDDEHRRHYVCPIMTQYQDYDADMSLEAVLAANARSGVVGQVVFSREQRLAVAATLALNTVYLEGSWLRTHWRSRDVFLTSNGASPDCLSTDRSSKIVSVEPYLSWKVVENADSGQNTIADLEMSRTMTVHRIRNEALFALALALIELSFGKTLQDLKLPGDSDTNEVLCNLRIASRLLPSVYAESGLTYGDVVRRCLDCPFDMQVASLDDAKFQRAVFEIVVEPLVEDFTRFVGIGS